MMEFSRVYDFWFGKGSLSSRSYVAERLKMWFGKSPQLDNLIREDFTDLMSSPILNEWAEQPKGLLCSVIVLDQFPRNAFRNTKRMYEYDPRALGFARDAIDRNLHNEMDPFEAMFLLLPLEHSEELADQEESVSLFTALHARTSAELSDLSKGLVDYAIRHRDIVKRFGRFPHRNAILGRENTRDESAFLREAHTQF